MIKLILSFLLLIFVHFSFAVNIKSNKISSKQLLQTENLRKLFSSVPSYIPATEAIKLLDTQEINKFYYLEYETLNIRWAKQSINRGENKNKQNNSIGIIQSVKKQQSNATIEIEDRKNWLYKFNY
jgi:hypothetical protein